MQELFILNHDPFELELVQKPGAVYPHIVQILRYYNRPGQIIVEIGCGGNQYAGFLQGMHIGTDLPGVKYGGKGPSVFSEGQRLPFKGDCVGLIYMVAVLYHIPDANAVLAECYRVLGNDGRLLVFDYNLATTKRLKRVRAAAHIWSPWELARRLREIGFKTRLIWDYPLQPDEPWKKFLLKFKLPRYLRFLCQLNEGWNIIVGTKDSYI